MRLEARRVVATRDVHAEVPTASDDPTGGVAAAAVVGAFCAEWIDKPK